MRPFYRVWQFWQVVTARPLDNKVQAEIETILTPPQMQLFSRFSANEQQHSYRVYKALCQAGQGDPDLLAAALLHDVGKTNMPRSWWDRPVVVLGQAFLSCKAAVWSQGEATRLTRPFVVKANHAEWGAIIAETAGSSPTTVALIRHHHNQPTAEMDEKLAQLLALLQWADDNS
jgi:putative nucleotidyltransferase with HDIG domain